ncbi:hypothetical protein AB1L42_14080 [Thalassoglobus sp. JC818]|uniref:ankyrin repeat domain-containing protein n=1 Tax=Thalassoglobus sp. JC818 TaxID=3232136 RepID=UPI003458DD52
MTVNFTDLEHSISFCPEFASIGEERYVNLYLMHRKRYRRCLDVSTYCQDTACEYDHKINPAEPVENEVARILGVGLSILEDRLGQYVDGWREPDFPEVSSISTAGLRAILDDQTVQIDETDINGLTLLNHAARQGRADLVDVLLENGADIDCGAIRCVLNLASHEEEKMVAIIERLIQSGADPDRAELKPVAPSPPGVFDLSTTSGTQRNSPLQQAADVGLQKVVRCLLRHGAKEARNSGAWHPAVRQIIGSALGGRLK